MKMTVLLFTIMIGILIIGGEAMAGNSQLAVAGVVLAGKCSFRAGGSIAFTLDPASGATATGTVTQPTLKCSKDAVYSITDDKGINTDGTNRRLKHASASEYIIYNITYASSGTGAGNSVSVPMNIAATIPSANFANARAGNYTDTIRFTITP